jgi:thioredoxin-dependent peroxiredoxin
MNMLDQSVPEFELPATADQTFNSRYAGTPYVLYFYPKDNTPGCTNEGLQFREIHALFTERNCAIYGISRDSLKSHESFKSKMSFPFELLSDADEIACKAFDVIKMKNMYGKKVRGIERSTFVIDSKGMVRREWRGVKVPGHAQEVLDFVSSMIR